jgi:hypothetical protein
MFTRRRGRLAVATLLAVMIGGLTLASALARPSDLQLARAATARFNSIAQAEAAGYGLPPEGPLHECIANLSGPGAMGFHLINGDLLDTTVDPANPEALVYAPDENGKLKLVAVEYVVFQEPWQDEFGPDAMAPMLFGEMFMLTPAPNRYEIPAFYALHAWLWQTNPAGTFESFNRNVSC